MEGNIPNTVEYIAKHDTELQIGELKAEELRILAAVNQGIAGTPDLEKLIDYLFESTRALFPCDRMGIAFFEFGGTRLVSHYVIADYQPLLLNAGFAEDISKSSLLRIVQDKCARIINDISVYHEMRKDSLSTRLLIEEGVRSSMTIPLFLRGQVVGLLFRSSRKPNAYCERDIRKHRALSERLGQAVEKAYRIKKLTEAKHAYSELLSIVGAPFYAVLQAAQNELDAAAARLTTGDIEESKTQLEALSSRIHDINGNISLLRELMIVEDPEFSAHIRSGIHLENDVVEPALKSIAKELRESGMALEVILPEEKETSVICDPQLLSSALTHLLQNAIRFSSLDGYIRLKIDRDADGLKLAVFNEGKGLNPLQQYPLFRRFSRIKDLDLAPRQGPGVGLFIAWCIAHAHGGRISADSAMGQYAEFTIIIPQ